jgi:hypothetical protein
MSAGNQAPKAKKFVMVNPITLKTDLAKQCSFRDDELLGLRQVLEWIEWHDRLEARYPEALVPIDAAEVEGG